MIFTIHFHIQVKQFWSNNYQSSAFNILSNNIVDDQINEKKLL